MRVASTTSTCVPALTESRYAKSPFSCKGVTDMTRSFLFVASLALLGSTQTTALAADGKALYETTCIACHGAKAQGVIPGIPDLAKGRRLAKPDAELVANILNGFQSNDSPMAMPPKGGNPNLTAADAKAILAYMRTITGTSASPMGAHSVTPTPAPAAAATASAPTAAMAPVPATAAAALAVSSPPPAAAPALQQDMAAFARGAKAWGDNCARCHNMRDPKDLSDRDWKVVTTHMRLRAGLDGQDVRDITAFLQASN